MTGSGLCGGSGLSRMRGGRWRLGCGRARCGRRRRRNWRRLRRNDALQQGIAQRLGKWPLAEYVETFLQPRLQRLQTTGLFGQLAHDVEIDFLADARRFTIAELGPAAGDEGRREFRRGFLVADCYIEALPDLALRFRLGRHARVGRVGLEEIVFLAERRDDVKGLGLANDEIVAAVVDGISLADEDSSAAVVVAGQAQAADYAVAVQGPVIELVLLAEVTLLELEVGVGKQMAAKIVGSLEADEIAARLGRRLVTVAIRRGLFLLRRLSGMCVRHDVPLPG
jgi:hypothetical protein